VVAGILSSVRLVGSVAGFVYVVYVFLKFINNYKNDYIKIILGFLLTPIGIACFMVFLYHHTGDALAFSHIQRAWGRIPQNPLLVIAQGINGSLLNQYWTMLSLLSLGCAVFLFIKKQYELAVFSLIGTLLPLSTGLASMPRYIFWQAPILLSMALLISRGKIWIIVFPALITGLVFMYFAWFTGKGFVV